MIIRLVKDESPYMHAVTGWDLPKGTLIMYLGSRRVSGRAAIQYHFYLLPNGMVESSYLGPGFAVEV